MSLDGCVPASMLSVRRQSFWVQRSPELRECLAHLVGLIMRRTVYLRYVDDIKILAKTELDLRAKLVKLDIASKEIGLFPQTAKINMRKVTDPEDEIKSVSRPLETSVVPACLTSALMGPNRAI